MLGWGGSLFKLEDPVQGDMFGFSQQLNRAPLRGRDFRHSP